MPDPRSTRTEMERRLEQHYRAAPRLEFARTLEQRLLETAKMMQTETPVRPARRARRFFQLSLSLAGLALIVVILALAMQTRVPPSAGGTPAPTGTPIPPATQAGVAPGATAAPTGTPFPTATSAAPAAQAAPRRLVPGLCPAAASATPGGPVMDHQLQGVLGGGAASAGGFTFDLRLACDPNFRRSSPDARMISEFENLGIAAAWSYDGAAVDGDVAEYTGFKPYVTMIGTIGPALEKGSGDSFQQGIQFPAAVFVDLPAGDLSFSYVLKLHTPDDRWAGAELRFTLRPQVDGYHPVDVSVRALNSAELAAAATPDISSFTLLPTLAPAQVDPALGRLAGLLVPWEDRALNAPGWLRLQQRIEYAGERGFLPNGAVMPAVVFDDSWYLLDEKGYVQRSITRQLTEQGAVLQVSVMSDGRYRNLTMDDSGSAGDPWRLGLGFDFYEQAARAVRQGVTISETITTLDGVPALQYTLDFSGYRSSIWIDAASGQPRMHEDWTSPGAGQPMALDQRATILSMERADAPPAELLALFDATPTPYRAADPIGTLAPADFDPAQSTVGMKMVPADSFTRPSFWYGDLYALPAPVGEDGIVNDPAEIPDGSYLLGRVDFGATPGGWCDRSADGRRLAFKWDWPGDDNNHAARLRWIELSKPGLVYEPDPDLNLQSPATFAPSGYTLAFFACKGQACGLYLLDADGDNAPARLLSRDIPGAAPLIWKPDGAQIASENVDEQGNRIVIVFDAQSGKIIYQGPRAGSPVESWGAAIFEGMTGFGRCTNP